MFVSIATLSVVDCRSVLQSNVWVSAWILISMFVIFGGVFFLLSGYDDRKDMNTVDLRSADISFHT